MITPGSHIRLNIGGNPIEFSPSVMENVSGKTYKISDSTKRVWRSPEFYPQIQDLDQAIQNYPYEKINDKFPYLKIYRDGTTYADRVDPANLKSINFLGGRITFKDSYDTTGGTFYVESQYIPLSLACIGRTLDIETSADLADVTRMGSLQEDTSAGSEPHRRKEVQLYETTISINGYESIEDKTFFNNDNNFYFEIYWDTINYPLWKTIAKVKMSTESASIDIENPNEFSVEFESNEPTIEVRT